MRSLNSWKPTETPYYVLREEQIECLTSPVRTDIVDHLSAHGVMSIKELARSIGKRPSAIYHHLSKLMDVDLVSVVGSRVVNRKSEKLYATPSRRMRLSRALADEENSDVMERLVSALCRQTDRDFAKGTKSEFARRSGAYQNLKFCRLVNRPSAQALKEINEKLDEIAEILWREPDPKRPLVSFTWTMSPLESELDE